MIVETAREAVAARGRFTIALAGGATPRETYARLGHPPLRESMPWDRTWVFFGDERAVPPDHRESNYRMAHEALLSAVPLPPAQVFRMRAEAEDQEAAAAEYAEAMLKVFGTAPDELPRFDLVLLGLGIDGHTASLFPEFPGAEGNRSVGRLRPRRRRGNPAATDHDPSRLQRRPPRGLSERRLREGQGSPNCPQGRAARSL